MQKGAFENAKRLVIKVGTSTLVHETGKININSMRRIVEVISDLMNSGIEVALVSSGAIAAGMGKLGLEKRPSATAQKQAVSMVGQCELMFMYDKMFGEYGHTTGQLLMAKRDVEHDECRQNLINAFERIFQMKAIPVVNENDAVAVEEIVYGDNDSLSAIVASLVRADGLIILTDTDGLYDNDPVKEKAKLIPVVETVTEGLYEMAGGVGSKFGTGGMVTKIQAAQIAMEAGIDTVVTNGSNPEDIYRLIKGERIGTLFVARKGETHNA